MESSGCRIAQSKEYRSFRNAVPHKTVVVETVDENDIAWKMYDFGPRDITHPVIFLPPASGTADVFFYQILALGSMGYRVIAVDYPPHWTHEEWVDGFRKLLDTLKFDKVHLVGASLGGFLAQKVAELMHRQARVLSVVLINSFCDTSVFKDNSFSGVYWAMPGFVLKRMLLSNFPQDFMERSIADSVDFMVERLESIKQKELASRLTLNSLDGYVEPQMLNNVPLTIIDVFDNCALSTKVRDELTKLYPHAKGAHLKSGGNFPYLSRPDEVNMYLKIHLREFARDVMDLKGEAERRMAEKLSEMEVSQAKGVVIGGRTQRKGKVSAKAAAAPVAATAVTMDTPPQSQLSPSLQSQSSSQQQTEQQHEQQHQQQQQQSGRRKEKRASAVAATAAAVANANRVADHTTTTTTTATTSSSSSTSATAQSTSDSVRRPKGHSSRGPPLPDLPVAHPNDSDDDL